MSDKHVSWTEDRLAGRRWVHLRGSRLAAFRQLGALASREIHHVLNSLPETVRLRRWAAAGAGPQTVGAIATASAADYPDEWAELEALAGGAGVGHEQMVLANLRGDLGVVDGTGCTDLAVRGRRNVVAHNEDGAPALAETLMIVTLEIDDDPVVTLQWYPGFLPGNAHVVTDRGLAWGIDHVQVQQPPAAAGRHFLARRLQRAASLDDAVAILRRSPTAGGFAYTIGEIHSRRIAQVEAAAGHVDVHEVAADDRPVWHTNHLGRLPATIDRPSPGAAGSNAHALGPRRESEARSMWLAQNAGDPPLDRPVEQWAFHILADQAPPSGVRRRAEGDDPLMTLTTTVVDLDARSITVRSAPHDEEWTGAWAEYLGLSSPESQREPSDHSRTEEG